MNDAHIGAVGLPTTGKRPVAFEELEKSAAVLVYILRLVFVEAGEVKRGLRHRTDTAESG